MNYSEHSKNIGKSEGYFRSLEKNTPLLFRTIRFIGRGDLSKGYFLLQEKIEDIYKQFENIYFSYEVPYQFASMLHKKGLYSSTVVANNTINNLFGKGLTLKGAKARKKIIRKYYKNNTK